MKIGLKPKPVGGFIKRSILPDDMSITQAADILSLGRPALSSLLNEKSALSPEMALSLKRFLALRWRRCLRCKHAMTRIKCASVSMITM